jgi:hypothetical protein
MNSDDSLFHALKFKVNEDKWSIYQEISSTLFKILLEDMKDSLVMIPFNYYSSDDIWFLDFRINWI